jgi:hypothetical protein
MVLSYSPVVVITSQRSSRIPSPQTRFMLLIREHTITWLIECNLVKSDNAAYCSSSNLPPGQGQSHALMLRQEFERPPHLWVHVTAVAE